LEAQYKKAVVAKEPATWTKETQCKWIPSDMSSLVPDATNTRATKYGWIVSSCSNVKLETSDTWVTNTRQGAICNTDGSLCEVVVSSKIGTTQEDLCGGTIEIVSGGGTCKSSVDCGKHGQCIGSGTNSSCKCIGCFSGPDCSIKDTSACSTISSSKGAPMIIFTGVAGFIIFMSIVFITLGALSVKKDKGTKTIYYINPHALMPKNVVELKRIVKSVNHKYR